MILLLFECNSLLDALNTLGSGCTCLISHVSEIDKVKYPHGIVCPAFEQIILMAVYFCAVSWILTDFSQTYPPLTLCC